MNRQQYKEASCYLAIRQGFGLIRRGSEIHAISVFGNTRCVSRSLNPENTWKDAYHQLLNKEAYENKIDPYTLPQGKDWYTENIDPDTGFVIRSE